MQEMTMVERVARAIYRCDGAVYGTDERMFDPFPFDELDEIQVAVFMDRARAAIEAMREPTEDMLIALEANGGKWRSDTPVNCRPAYSAMIDAALSE